MFSFEITKFKAVMGIKPTQYIKVSNLLNIVVLPAIAEIKKVHKFKISLEKIKTGRKITSLRFSFNRFEERWTGGDEPQKRLVPTPD